MNKIEHLEITQAEKEHLERYRIIPWTSIEISKDLFTLLKISDYNNDLFHILKFAKGVLKAQKEMEHEKNTGREITDEEIRIQRMQDPLWQEITRIDGEYDCDSGFYFISSGFPTKYFLVFVTRKY